MNDKPDNRKHDVGEKVTFTDDEGKQAPGVIHGVRYKQGRYELTGYHLEDNHKPESESNKRVPGTGQLQLVPGSESERHSFEYIIVHEGEHKAWRDVEDANQEKLKAHQEKIKLLKEGNELPSHPMLEPHPPLKQHIRIFED